jgi:hypothetical protein
MFLTFRIFTLNKSELLREVKENNIILPIVTELPNFNVVDPNFSILKDIIKSSELEQWTNTVKRDGNGYDILLSNASNSLQASCRIRLYNDSIFNNPIRLAWFQIKKMNGNTQECVLSYSDDDIEVKCIVLPFIWNYVLKYHQDIYDNTILYYNNAMTNIRKELKTLNRDRQLDDILKEA